jgi:two-component system, sensor histidine kinase LadS
MYMPYLLSRLLWTTTLWVGMVGFGAWAATPPPSPTADAILLADGAKPFSLQQDLPMWLESGTQAGIDAVAKMPMVFSPTSPNTLHALGQDSTLWIRLRVLRPVGSNEPWMLNIPTPYLDSITLYQRQINDQWLIHSAGDTLPQAQWHRRGLYPEFALELPPGVPQDIFLQVRNYKPLSFPLQLATTQARETQRLLENIALGLALGMLLTMVTLSTIRYFEHDNPFDIQAAAYSLLVVATLAQINGLLNAVVWNDWPAWADYASSVFPLLAVGSGLLFVRKLYSLNTQHPRADKVLGAVGWFTLTTMVSYVVLDRTLASELGLFALLLATCAGLLATLLSWRNGSTLGAWLLVAYVPQLLCVLWLVAEAFGLVPARWEMRYLLSLAVAMAVPTLVYALSRATHDRKEVAVRADHLPTQDALTGLLTSQAFQSHVEDAYQRAVEHREPVALVLVSVTNLDRIRASMGDTTAEQCMLRAVIKLHRVLRDVDTAARIDTARFAILFEGASDRQALTERLVKLVASGLVPLQGLEPEVTLQFQAACLLLQENPLEASHALSELSALLANISPRTRRPIRFLEPVPTQAAPLESVLESV